MPVWGMFEPLADNPDLTMTYPAIQPVNLAMTVEERKSHLLRGDAARISRRLRPPVSAEAVYHELRGSRPRSLRIRRALSRLIAKRAGVPEEAVFGPGSLGGALPEPAAAVRRTA